jgi:hypothetical protein
MSSASRLLLLAAVLGTAAASPARASEPSPAAQARATVAPAKLVVLTPAAITGSASASLDSLPAAPALEASVKRSPLMAAIAAVLDDEERQLTALRTDLSHAALPAQALEIQRHIEQVKQGTEIQLLRVQADHARASGNFALATRIEEAIAQQLQPRLRLEPRDRPAPVPGAAR